MAKLRTDHKGIDRYEVVTERGVFILEPARAMIGPDRLLPRVVLREDCEVSDERDVMVIGPIGSRKDYLTVTFRPEVQITTGCFTGSLEQFTAEVEGKDDGLHKAEYQAALAFIVAIVPSRRRR